MSYEHNRFALDAVRLYNLPARAGHVLFALAMRSDAAGRCHPSIRTIAADTARDVHTVTAAIAELEAAVPGFVVERLGLRRGNRYTIPAFVAQGDHKHPSGYVAQVRNKAADALLENGAALSRIDTRFVAYPRDATALELLIELGGALYNGPIGPNDVLACPERSRERCGPACATCAGMGNVYAWQLGLADEAQA